MAEWEKHGNEIDSPVSVGAAVTPHDSTNFTNYIRCLYVGVAGNVVYIDLEDNVITLVGVQAGSWNPIRAKRVNSTSTTATNMVGYYK